MRILFALYCVFVSRVSIVLCSSVRSDPRDDDYLMVESNGDLRDLRDIIEEAITEEESEEAVLQDLPSSAVITEDKKDTISFKSFISEGLLSQSLLAQLAKNVQLEEVVKKLKIIVSLASLCVIAATCRPDMVRYVMGNLLRSGIPHFLIYDAFRSVAVPVLAGNDQTVRKRLAEAVSALATFRVLGFPFDSMLKNALLALSLPGVDISRDFLARLAQQAKKN